MVESDGHLHEDWSDLEACAKALDKLQSFLHGNLSEDQADLIREHLLACEKCMDDFDVEVIISDMLRRCNPPSSASKQLRSRIMAMTSVRIVNIRAE